MKTLLIGEKFEVFETLRHAQRYPRIKAGMSLIGVNQLGLINYDGCFLTVDNSLLKYGSIGQDIKLKGRLVITKLPCHICGKKTDLICTKCEEYFCENCQAPYNQFSQIDYDCCESCYNSGRPD